MLLKKGYNYCPKCGQEVLTRGDKSSVAHGSHLNGNQTVENHVGTVTAPTRHVHAPGNKESVKLSPAHKCFSAFKKSKEKERSSFFVRKKGIKQAKSETMEVKITVAVIEDNKVKRENSLPLKVPATSTADDILNAAVQKHTAFNKHFNSRHEYLLVFKDGTNNNNLLIYIAQISTELFSIAHYNRCYNMIRLVNLFYIRFAIYNDSGIVNKY